MNTKRFRNAPPQQAEVLRQFEAVHPEKSLQVGEHSWHYLVSGQGERTLLILVGGSRMAETAFKLISAFECDYRVIVPTYPDVLELRLAEEGINAILDAEGVGQVTVMGASFGGMVAQGFVRRYPQRVEQLILSNTAGILPSEYVAKLDQGLKMIRWLPMWLMRSKMRQQLMRHSDHFPAEEKAFWQAVLSGIADAMTKASLRSQFACMRDVYNRHFTVEDLAGWKGSILVIESDSDPSFPDLMRQSMHLLYPQAQFVNFPDAGHIPMISEWEAYHRSIRDFLTSPIRQAAVPTLAR